MNAVALRTIQPITEHKPKILVVDDDWPALFLLATQVEDMDYDVITAQDGVEALDLLGEVNDIDVILLDLEMPKMNGAEMVARMKEDPRLAKIPVIMQTGHNQPEQIKKGIDEGAFYYLTKPLAREVLKSVLKAALRDVKEKFQLKSEIQHQKNSFGLVDNCNFTISKLAEAEQLATVLASLYPTPSRALLGINELLTNAVEHGCLEMYYDDKSKYLADGTWEKEIRRRQELPENRSKRIGVKFLRKNDGLYLTISDGGKGFNWRPYMTVTPDRAMDNHGRGIALANMVSFDNLAYNEIGNTVTAFAKFES